MKMLYKHSQSSCKKDLNTVYYVFNMSLFVLFLSIYSVAEFNVLMNRISLVFTVASDLIRQEIILR